MTNRRNFIKSASLLTAGGLLAGTTGAAHASSPSVASSAASKKKLGLQIYSLQKELYDDLPKRMKELKNMGYVNLELAGYGKGKIGDVEMMEFRKMAEDAGLKIVSSHVNPSIEGVPFLMEYKKEILPQVKEYWIQTVADHVKLGCKFLIQPMMPMCRTYEEALLVCEFFNEAGKICKDAGLLFGYHNHHMEFQRLLKPGEEEKFANPFAPKGEQIQDIFIANTDPSLVCFELDVYWTVRGGNDPLAYLKKHSDRIKALHIKDVAVLGQSGMLNFENIFKQMYKNGIEDYFVELEQMPDGRTQFAGVKDCAAYLKKASFVK
ncbi:sugar phosphate isomerase/epimerase [Parabacteroides sp. PF5-5]|uniref:sugar phosphate isomerase/epimerase family protein n=1 Tax=unclassified Parabacteroides TaxID=2649774 RepID=UPI0024769B92|nr:MULTISPECIES: sugar phosphate isomerase/epimerase [unclassified Parabacteroides]MDH6306158.1 sugar phosphate isomerase/epimerase [Parabacteroides sp. PH5-39]MDH6317117.1 sugar phosphate isomerase/epimerase [Parabacteroides sp. PF5-13]MDH6320870.1 sugar phosphate isomerase/epimerase [Parabacteroides sp. PH5-13]MDH6324601.1 sugar phosphate isomerase/epimerase [Parabacteroides sp. PH5-8]MDH6328348.1 sugar phosphate isomerase/epimerase [Parabacteroides sp. PH5-41]